MLFSVLQVLDRRRVLTIGTVGDMPFLTINISIIRCCDTRFLFAWNTTFDVLKIVTVEVAVLLIFYNYRFPIATVLVSYTSDVQCWEEQKMVSLGF